MSVQTIIVLTKEHGVQAFQIEGTRADAEQLNLAILRELARVGLNGTVVDMGKR